MKILSTIVALLAVTALYGQTPELFNYQGIARDNGGNPLTSDPIGLRITIHSTSATGPVVYQETHALTTSALGLFTTQVGAGTVVSGSMAGISWGTDTYYMEVEMDETGGTVYAPMGTTQLISVPYAFHAETAANVTNDQVDDADADPSNELQDISLSGTDLSISSGSTVDLSSLQDGTGTDDQNISGSGLSGTTLTIGIENGTSETVDLSSLQDGVNDADADPTNELQDWSTLPGIPADIADGDDVNDADADPANELNTGASLSGTTLSITDAGGAQTVDLSSLQDGTGTDDQNISGSGLSGTTLTIGIENGSSETVDLSSLQDGVNDADADPTNELQDWSTLPGIPADIADGDDVNDADADPANELNTGASLSGTTLSITDAGGAQTVDLSSLQDGTGTDDQTLSLSGNTLTIEDGNSVDLSGVGGADSDWTVSGSDMYSAVSGNVGIGTSTPSTELHIKANNIAATLAMESNNGSQWRALVDDDDSYSIWSMTDIKEHLTVAQGGNVGIGTTTPASLLNVSGNPTAGIGQLTVQGTDNGVLNLAYMSFLSADGTRMGWIGDGSTVNDDINIGATVGDLRLSAGSGTPDIFIDNTTEYVGISTTTPSATLDVEGTFQLVDGTEGAGKVLTSDANGNASWQAPSSGADSDWTVSGSDMYSAVSGNVGIGTTTPNQPLVVVGDVTMGGGAGGYDGTDEVFTMSAQSDAWQLGVNNTGAAATTDFWIGNNGVGDQFRIESNGNVGIGTTAPLVPLEVNLELGEAVVFGNASNQDGIRLLRNNATSGYIQAGDGGPTDQLVFTRFGSSNNLMNFDVRADNALFNGNVGIGTTTPSVALDIHGGDDVGEVWVTNPNSKPVLALRDSGGTMTEWAFHVNNEGGEFLTNTDNQNKLFLSTRGSFTRDGSHDNVMTFSTNGNTGIGTTTPSSTLDIVGDFQLVDGTQAAGHVLTSDANGNASWQAPSSGASPQYAELQSTGPNGSDNVDYLWGTELNSNLGTDISISGGNITINTTGLYQISFSVASQNLSSSERDDVYLRVNGADVDRSVENGGATGYANHTGMWVGMLTSGDVITLRNAPNGGDVYAVDDAYSKLYILKYP